MDVDRDGFVRASYGQGFDHLSLKTGVDFPFASDMWKDNWIVDRDTKDAMPMRDVFDGVRGRMCPNNDRFEAAVEIMNSEDRLLVWMWYAERALKHMSPEGGLDPKLLMEWVPHLAEAPPCPELMTDFYSDAFTGVRIKRTHKLPYPFSMGVTEDGTGVFPQFQRIVSFYGLKLPGVANPKRYPNQQVSTGLFQKTVRMSEVCTYCFGSQSENPPSLRHRGCSCPYAIEGRLPPWCIANSELGLSFLGVLAALCVVHRRQVDTGYDRGTDSTNMKETGVWSVGLTYMDFRHLWQGDCKYVKEHDIHFGFYQPYRGDWTTAQLQDQRFGYFSRERRRQTLETAVSAPLDRYDHYSYSQSVMVRADGTYEDDSSAGKRQRIEVQGRCAEEYQAVIPRWATVWDEGPIFEDKPLWVEQFEGPEGVRCARLLADKYFQSYLLREALDKGEETPCQLC